VRAESAIPALTKALNDENKDIQQTASGALDVIRGRTPTSPKKSLE
jgi:hypothetical protein